eukprot:GILK01008257.1.p1 GENE.GILK01008257.1~~GILK01008257.1.p1  ORF type:complete len:331 (+),score=61.32 GILK01008257.1:52-993(+)
MESVDDEVDGRQEVIQHDIKTADIERDIDQIHKHGKSFLEETVFARSPRRLNDDDIQDPLFATPQNGASPPIVAATNAQLGGGRDSSQSGQQAEAGTNHHGTHIEDPVAEAMDGLIDDLVDDNKRDEEMEEVAEEIMIEELEEGQGRPSSEKFTRLLSSTSAASVEEPPDVRHPTVAEPSTDEDEPSMLVVEEVLSLSSDRNGVTSETYTTVVREEKDDSGSSEMPSASRTSKRTAENKKQKLSHEAAEQEPSTSKASKRKQPSRQDKPPTEKKQTPKRGRSGTAKSASDDKEGKADVSTTQRPTRRSSRGHK